jgi:hypothetical protein
LTTLADLSVTPSVTTGPITGSTKIYTEVDGLRIPLRRVRLSNGRHVDVMGPSTGKRIEAGMAEKATEFVDRGERIYLPVTEA